MVLKDFLLLKFFSGQGDKCIDDRKVPILLVIIQAVADDKPVRDLKPHVVERNVHNPPGRLIQQGAHLQR